jgi:hypothetical protein
MFTLILRETVCSPPAIGRAPARNCRQVDWREAGRRNRSGAEQEARLIDSLAEPHMSMSKAALFIPPLRLLDFLEVRYRPEVIATRRGERCQRNLFDMRAVMASP